MTWSKLIKPWELLDVAGSIVITGVLTHCELLDSVCEFKATEMNVQRILIRESMEHEFEMGRTIAEANNNICYAKLEGSADHCTVSRRFRTGCKNLDNKVSSGKIKTIGIRTNQMCNSKLVLGELSITVQRYSCLTWPQQKYPELQNSATHYENTEETFDLSRYFLNDMHMNHFTIINQEWMPKASLTLGYFYPLPVGGHFQFHFLFH